MVHEAALLVGSIICSAKNWTLAKFRIYWCRIRKKGILFICVISNFLISSTRSKGDSCDVFSFLSIGLKILSHIHEQQNVLNRFFQSGELQIKSPETIRYIYDIRTVQNTQSYTV